MQRSIRGWIGLYTLVFLGMVFLLVPVLWMFTISIRPSNELYVKPFQYIPATPTLDNYVSVIMNRTVVPAHLEIGLVRTSIVAVCSTLLAVAIATLAGYSLARFRFRGRESYGLFMLITQMMPAILFLVPLFIILRGIGLVNTLPGLILSYLTFSLPFCTWLLRGYFLDIPVEIEEAALVDGCNRIQALIRVVLPMAAPALIATGTYAFILAWNEFLFAFILAGEKPLLTVQLYSFIGQYGPEYGNLMASAVLVAVPPVVLFLLVQKYLVSGLTAGAGK